MVYKGSYLDEAAILDELAHLYQMPRIYLGTDIMSRVFSNVQAIRDYISIVGRRQDDGFSTLPTGRPDLRDLKKESMSTKCEALKVEEPELIFKSKTDPQDAVVTKR